MAKFLCCLDLERGCRCKFLSTKEFDAKSSQQMSYGLLCLLHRGSESRGMQMAFTENTWFSNELLMQLCAVGG